MKDPTPKKRSDRIVVVGKLTEEPYQDWSHCGYFYVCVRYKNTKYFFAHSFLRTLSFSFSLLFFLCNFRTAKMIREIVLRE